MKRAALLLALFGQYERHYFVKKDIDQDTYNKGVTSLQQELDALHQKWKATARSREFEANFPKQRVTQEELDAFFVPHYSPLVQWTRNISIALAWAGGICLAVWLFSRLFRRTERPPSAPSDVYGTAHYAPWQEDIEDEACLSNGLFLGKSSAPNRRAMPLDAYGAPVCSTPEHHTLIVARTGTGKGTRVIVPTLLRYGGSALVIDPKGENAAITAVVRASGLHQSVHIINPWNEMGPFYAERGFLPATYNPLDILDREDPNAVAIAQTLAGAICPTSPGDKDAFWVGSAAGILAGVILWLADQPGEKKTLARVRQIISLAKSKFEKECLVPMAASDGFSGAVRELAAPFIGMADQTYSGIMANLSESTRFLSDPQIKAATASSSFSMQDLATKKTTVYVVIPGDRMETQQTWLRLMIAAAMHTFKHPDTKLRSRRHRCLFLIDEFPALGRLKDMPGDLSTMRGHGVDFALVVQGLDQLKNHYGEARREIENNCHYKWFCNVGDLESAEWLSKTLGKATVQTTGSSQSFSSGTGSSSSSTSTTHGETGRALLTPDEILTLGRDVAIGIQPKGHPHYLKPIDYWNLRDAFTRLEDKHPALYWDPILVYDKNPYYTPPPPPGGGNGGSGGKEKARSGPSSRRQKMTEAEARKILEIEPDASPTEILAAYRRLMLLVHPDHGGTSHFAQELNAAKELLMGG